MAVSFIGGGRITGLSSDAKPTTDIPAGTRFLETDTQLLYVYNGTSWISVTEANVKDVIARDLLEEIRNLLKIQNAYFDSMMDDKLKTEDIENE